MIYKKFVVMGLAFFAILFNVSFAMAAQAQTFDKIIPTYGLFCEDSELIKSGTVNFDLTDTELLSNGMGRKRSSYQVSAANREVEFAIPFISSAKNVPDISVSVNGQMVDGSVWYGHSGFWQGYEFDIDKTYSPVLDENLIGTLYTVIPDSDAITVSLKFSEIRSYIYETSSAYSSSQSADGSDVWTLKNALSKSSYSFFVLGDSTVFTFESSCEYQMKQLTCKEYIDSQYKYYEEYYEYLGGVPVELFYSIVNRVIINNTYISYEGGTIIPLGSDIKLNVIKYPENAKYTNLYYEIKDGEQYLKNAYTSNAITSDGELSVLDDLSENCKIAIVAHAINTNGEEIISRTLTLSVQVKAIKEVEILTKSDIVHQGETVRLSVSLKPYTAEADEVQYAIISGQSLAKIDKDTGILTVNNSADIGGKISVIAIADGVESKPYVFTVSEIFAENLTLVDSNGMAINKIYNLINPIREEQFKNYMTAKDAIRNYSRNEA